MPPQCLGISIWLEAWFLRNTLHTGWWRCCIDRNYETFHRDAISTILSANMTKGKCWWWLLRIQFWCLTIADWTMNKPHKHFVQRSPLLSDVPFFISPSAFPPKNRRNSFARNTLVSVREGPLLHALYNYEIVNKKWFSYANCRYTVYQS